MYRLQHQIAGFWFNTVLPEFPTESGSFEEAVYSNLSSAEAARQDHVKRFPGATFRIISESLLVNA